MTTPEDYSTRPSTVQSYVTTPAERPSMNVVQAIEKIRSYLRCPFCGCKSPSTHGSYGKECVVTVLEREVAALKHDISRSVATSSELATELAEFAAIAAASGGEVEVRAQRYNIVYDVKCQRIEKTA